jgi:succinoglycan biosynthesis transport protein ExoP
MTIGEILSILWRRKLIVVALTAVAIGAAVGSLRVISPQYESTSTLALNPPEASGLNSLAFFQAIDPLVSIYATAAKTSTTQSVARSRLDGRLASISVQTFSGSPVFKISGRSTDRSLAERSAQAVSDVLLGRARQGSLGISSLRLAQIDRPSYPRSQVYPDQKLTLAVAVLLGLGLGIAGAFLRESLGSRIRTRSELAEAAGVPVYAELPVERAVSRPGSVERLLLDPSLWVFLEAVRELQTNIAFGDKGANSVVVTSPEGQHGKSTVAISLAVATARAGMRTILVDADLRRGTIAERLRLESSHGLSDVLRGEEPSTHIQATSLPELDVLASGRLIPESGELLASSFRHVLERLTEMYEMVIIDTTPLVPVNDARVVASFAKATIIVGAAGKASQRSVQEAVERLAFIAVRPTAAVLNKSKRRTGGGYYPHEVHERASETRAADRGEQHRSAAAP